MELQGATLLAVRSRRDEVRGAIVRGVRRDNLIGLGVRHRFERASSEREEADARH